VARRGGKLELESASGFQAKEASANGNSFKGSKPHIRCYTWSRGAIYAQPFYQKEATSGPAPAY